MSGIQCVGDQNVAGGRILSGDNTVFINGKPVAPVGSPVSCHNPGKGEHTHARTTNQGANFQVFVNGRQITVSGSIDSCGHPRYTPPGSTVGIG
jgi:uncharacterized Zn-binding protein involved in type VI secretion